MWRHFVDVINISHQLTLSRDYSLKVWVNLIQWFQGHNRKNQGFPDKRLCPKHCFCLFLPIFPSGNHEFSLYIWVYLCFVVVISLFVPPSIPLAGFSVSWLVLQIQYLQPVNLLSQFLYTHKSVGSVILGNLNTLWSFVSFSFYNNLYFLCPFSLNIYLLFNFLRECSFPPNVSV